MRRPVSLTLLAAAGMVLVSPAAAQIGSIDPNAAPPPQASAPAPVAAPAPAATPDSQAVDPGPQAPGPEAPAEAPPPQAAPAQGDAASAHERASAEMRGATMSRNDVFSAAEGVFGKGARGLGDVIEKLLRDQGEPNAYITGREAGGAFVLGVRYGSGTLHHQIEGDRPIYWTGPSLGFDFGADANKVFVLVYNLHDGQDIFHRYPAAEGHAYVVGGFTASYLRRKDIVLIPVRLGVGARLGVNAGYMRFSEKNRWLPF
ncbi:MAG: hypothetical protein QOH81_302 [Sphingomonadales bacterium]|jgi:hypothetical protein|nr:hypothetical protein [Sphingomonadales bacterium]